MWRISSDTGGTFTDCFAQSEDGAELRCKVLSTGTLRARLVRRLGEGIWQAGGLPGTETGFLKGFHATLMKAPGRRATVLDWEPGSQVITLTENWGAKAEPGDMIELGADEEAPVLGARLLTGTALGEPFPEMSLRVATTRATNALLERKGSPVVLFITRGFGDLLRIGDQRRTDLFALVHAPKPVFFDLVIEVEERLSADGEILTPLDQNSLLASARQAFAQGFKHAAVSLLHSSVNATHEQLACGILREAGFQHITISSEIAPFAKILARAQSAVANAYLTGPVEAFVAGITRSMTEVAMPRIMTSTGGLESCATVRPKDLLLSGPAGGAIGAASAARRLGFDRVLTLDMGGTSTDVARIDGRPGFRFEQDVAGMKLLAPCVAIETVAAGGGSICQLTLHGLAVGPESAGSDPGPACYGKGGPLTLTDVNLLLGRFDAAKAPIPLDPGASKQRLVELQQQILETEGREMDSETLLRGFLDLACERMADAIRRISVAEGYNPKDYALLAFGGAGPQHACDVAARLGMATVIAPHHAGILSAVGLHEALPERFAEMEVARPLNDALDDIHGWTEQLTGQAGGDLIAEGVAKEALDSPHCLAEVRLKGQDTPIQVPFRTAGEILPAYREAHMRLFGYFPPDNRVVELVALRVSVRQTAPPTESGPNLTEECVSDSSAQTTLIQDAFSTLVVPPGWSVSRASGVGHIVRRRNDAPEEFHTAPLLERDLLRHRFHSLVEEMGALLQRTAISTNIRERLDFSCALLDPEGQLLSSAPHIPVHLGALGVCVRDTVNALPLGPGDTAITNHPAFGGSHLPDVTLITPVHSDDHTLLGYVANRAHHAEIGGQTPGSMPASARRLAEEGVVIAPTLLVSAGKERFHQLETLLKDSPFPSRNPADNLADLHAQLAANRLGAERLKAIASADTRRIHRVMQEILEHSAGVMQSKIRSLPAVSKAMEALDDGHEIHVALRRRDDHLEIDFSGTSGVHPGNLNATKAIVRSAVLYFVRVLLQEDLPLNEGLLSPIRFISPPSLLNPEFSGDPERDPAVVGGNVEVSQRLVDTLFKALRLQACSQGTMNNLLFGDATFGYYETIGGGAGAGPHEPGASGLHTHMTNTAITDPEILERRFPVRLHQFAIRAGSGGAGRLAGGDGLVREFEFLRALTVSLLTQHRGEGPFGVDGGLPGSPGQQTLLRPDGTSERLGSSVSIDTHPGDRLRIETPGGGGWGAA